MGSEGNGPFRSISQHPGVGTRVARHPDP